MKRAVELALKGEGYVNPNPMVGAVIVKNNRIIGEGFHQNFGGPHAEINALLSCTESPADSDLYVTLEPCCHYGKTPPCTDSIIKSGIKRVFIGSTDPNPKVFGKGIKKLRASGIYVEENFLSAECYALNEIFFYYITKELPYLSIKYAMTADGKTACYTGESQWITSLSAREHVHFLRHKYSCIMTGIGTVLQDNPFLNCRIPNGKNPIRVICDSHLKIPLDCNICKTAKDIPTIIATLADTSPKIKLLESLGITILTIPEHNSEINFSMLIKQLGDTGIDSILLEGGGTLNYSAISSGLVNKIYAYIAPKIFGGQNAATPFGGIGIPSPKDCYRLSKPSLKYFGDDILLEYNTEVK